MGPDSAASAAAAAGALGVLGGLLVPALIARIPEPDPTPSPVTAGSETDVAVGTVPAGPAPAPEGPRHPEEPKEPYAAIAARPWVRRLSPVAAGAASAAVAATVGWSWQLLPLLYLVPVGVALAVVDWRTRLLPTKVVAPSYAVVVAACVAASALSGSWDDLVRAGFGWVVGGGTFLVLWLVYPAGMGYGDVRLAGVLGIALGHLGWGELVVGVFASFPLGAVVGLVLSGLKVVQRSAYPFGPFMLVGALVGVVAGADVAAAYVGGL